MAMVSSALISAAFIDPRQAPELRVGSSESKISSKLSGNTTTWTGESTFIQTARDDQTAVLTSPPRQTSLPSQLPSSKFMDPASVGYVLDWLATNLDHIPYVVSGLGAMAAYGFTGRQPKHISIICPAHCHGVIRCWAATMGMNTVPNRPDIFSIPCPFPTAPPRRVRIKYLHEGFESLRICRVGPQRTRVLALSVLVDYIAKAYMQPEATTRHPTAFDGWEGKDPVPRLTIYAMDIFWLLKRIQDEPAQKIRWEDVPNVRNPLFFDLFDCMYPGAKKMFKKAGLKIKREGIERCVDATPSLYGPRVRVSSRIEVEAYALSPQLRPSSGGLCLQRRWSTAADTGIPSHVLRRRRSSASLRSAYDTFLRFQEQEERRRWRDADANRQEDRTMAEKPRSPDHQERARAAREHLPEHALRDSVSTVTLKTIRTLATVGEEAPQGGSPVWVGGRSLSKIFRGGFRASIRKCDGHQH